MVTKTKKNSGKIKKQKNDASNFVSQNSDRTIDYFRDRALDTKDEDKFKHLHYVEVLKDILLKSETPINIGLYGKWGVGKSSIVHMLKETIINDKELKEFKYVEIDAWGLSRASLQQEILEEINIQLDGKAYQQHEIEDKLYNVQQIDAYDLSTLRKFWWLWIVVGIGLVLFGLDENIDIVTKLSTIGLSSILALLLPLTRLFVGTSRRIIPKTTSSLKFKEIYKKITDESEKKIVVVVDNLDRCNDEIAVELLGLIQTFMVKKNCINILACDDEAIITHLRNVKGDQYTDKDGNEFLSKFFQVTLRIPPFIGENLEKYTEDLMNRRSVPFKRFVRQVLISGAVENPRKINQFLNNAVALYRLAELKEKDQKLPKGVITKHTDFLTKMIIIRHEWPEFYKEIEEQPDILNNDEARLAWLEDRKQKYGKQNNEKENHSLHALKKFLNRTQISHVDDVIPFLRLNQESYAAESGMDEFGTAIATLDPDAETIFAKSEKQNQHLKKIEELMDENAEQHDMETLVTCSLSLIGILKHVKNPEDREFALATLGRHLSSSLLAEWNEFVSDKHNVFEFLEEMPRHLSTNFYKRLIHETFSGEKINDKLLFQFMERGNQILPDIMNLVDDKFCESILKHVDNLGFLVECCKNYHWNQNTISKPSKTISAITSHITFDSQDDDLSYRETYEKVRTHIHSSERGKFLAQIELSIVQFTDSGQPLSESLMNAINIIPEDLDENIPQKESIFNTISNSLERITDREQVKRLLNNMICLAEKLKNSDNVSIDVNEMLERTVVAYLGGAEHYEILNFLNEINSRKQPFLKSKAISTALVEQFITIGPNNTEILKRLLHDTPYESQDNIAEILNKLIRSKDPTQYSVLLETAQELDEGFNYSIIDSIRETCREVASEEDSDRHALYQHVLKLKPSSDDIREIVRYSQHLIVDQDIAKQNEGLELLTLVNSNTNPPTTHGVGKAIFQSIIFLKEDSPRVDNYLSFIFQNPKQWSFLHQTKLTELFREGLKPERSEQILNIILSYANTREEIVKYILDELIECAQQTPYGDAKEQIRQILISNRQTLVWTQENKIREIYGDSVLD